MTNGWMKIQIHKNSFTTVKSPYVQREFSVQACFDDLCFRRHRPIPCGGRRLWNDFRHRLIGSHRFGGLNFSTLRLVVLHFVNHRFLGHRGVLGREGHFFVSVGDPGESLLAESTLLP